MTPRIEISFAAHDAAEETPTAVLCAQDLDLSDHVKALIGKAEPAFYKAADVTAFKGRARSSMELVAVPGLATGRLVVVGVGRPGDLATNDVISIGGAAFGALARHKAAAACLVADLPGRGGRDAAETAADLAFGALLRSYTFDRYRTRKPEGDDAAPNGLQRLVVRTSDPDAAAAHFESRRSIAHGVFLARDLVNEPANALGPEEFAERMAALTETGLSVEVLDEDKLSALKMRALLAVGQGSTRPSRVVVMEWHGAKSKRAKPVCFVGKGVCFDTGGISIKPAGGMEDMKGDMGGAAAVAGVMRALAERKANVNAIGIIGLVENMPSGNAQRPGDIVTSMSGQTIEVINTDAEGRLVLADLLWYAQDRFKPRFIVNLATLTGAIMVALGKEHAGLFSNSDRLAGELTDAGLATGEKVWRMPLAPAYDKLLESRFADMKNIGGRWGGAITAAQFLQRFIKGTDWAHLDVAGTAMDSPKTEVSQSWASGWGVRLLDRLVADKYER
ncbi:MAG: leucyl aminopeptidase [Hyphomicrobiaceae bacterium]